MEEAAVSLASKEGIFAMLFLISYLYNVYDTQKREDRFVEIIQGLQATITIMAEENLSGIVAVTEKAEEVLRHARTIEQELYKANVALKKGGE